MSKETTREFVINATPATIFSFLVVPHERVVLTFGWGLPGIRFPPVRRRSKSR
jgi:hypothetical protein